MAHVPFRNSKLTQLLQDGGSMEDTEDSMAMGIMIMIYIVMIIRR